MNVGSLFSGIGGFDLGLERAGMRVAWQCEANEYRRRVLGLRWPGVPCYPDVREVDAGAVEPVDVLCGGFPCVDISHAGKRAGIDGPGSRLWTEMFRLVGELRPRYVIVENVSALLGRGMGRVLGDLAALGYDAEWGCLRAADFGAPHFRDRIWIVAYPECSGWDGLHEWGESRHLAPDAQFSCPDGSGGFTPKDYCRPVSGQGSQARCSEGPWAVEPNVGRVADGIPSRVDRLAALGDSLVPQIAEWIGRRLMEFERSDRLGLEEAA